MNGVGSVDGVKNCGSRFWVAIKDGLAAPRFQPLVLLKGSALSVRRICCHGGCRENEALRMCGAAFVLLGVVLFAAIGVKAIPAVPTALHLLVWAMLIVIGYDCLVVGSNISRLNDDGDSAKKLWSRAAASIGSIRRLFCNVMGREGRWAQSELELEKILKNTCALKPIFLWIRSSFR